MKYRRLGHSGLTVSVIGLGCNNLGRAHTPTSDRDAAIALVNEAHDAGITFFDCADLYGARPGLSEEILGEAIRGWRDDAVVATKFGLPVGTLNGVDGGARGSRRYIMRAVEGSLKRLGTDHIDLYYYHSPDPLTPLEETIRALDDLVREGKVRYIAHSNFAGWQIADAHHIAREIGAEHFIAAENNYNLLDRRAELEVIPAAQRFGLATVPYFPLANGLLTGKYSDGVAPQGSRLQHSKAELLEKADLSQLQTYREFVRERGRTEIEMSIGWLLAQPTVASVIAGATRPEQVRANAAVAQNLPTCEELAGIDDIFPAPERIALF